MHSTPFDFISLRRAYESGTSPQDIVLECFRRIGEIGDPGIFISLRDQGVVFAEAEALGKHDPASKPLWGIPFAVKDNIDAAGMPTTAACPDFEHVAHEDAFCVRRLREAGALLIGKTNLDQFATGLVGVRSPYPIPKNAIDPEIVPGGSSSGSAVAVAHGIVGFALGTDTAGSGRVPAALNNIVGLKPTLGALSASGVVPACRTLDTVSVFALTVDDAYAAYRAAAGYDDKDAYSKDIRVSDIANLPRGLVVGVPDANTIEFFGDTDQAASFSHTLALLKNDGVEIVELDFTPLYRIAEMLYEGAWVAERYAAIRNIVETRPDGLHPVTRQIISAANRLSAADAFDGIYRLQDLKRLAGPMIDGVDLLCVPTIPTFYTVSDLEADPIGPNSRLGTYTNFVNLLDLCGLAVPTAARGDGRPGGVTLLAAAGHDALIASLGARLHCAAGVALGATGWRQHPLPDRNPRPLSSEIAVAMVGAHMSGLPLNGDVTRLGGRYLYASKTAPSYRFYSLAGGPPKRPGLVRAENGASIALEVWALPEDQFGAFMKGIPQPLSIGTIDLADGSQANGFLCEPAGLEGAEDITACGGWRAYLQQVA